MGEQERTSSPVDGQVQSDPNPYSAPESQIRAPETANAGIPREFKVLMVVAIALSAGWPLYFSRFVTDSYGLLAASATFLLIAMVSWHFLNRDRDRFEALAKGLLTLGLLSLLPILPLVVGGISVYFVGSIIRPSGNQPLNPLAASLVTVLVAGFYIVAGLGIGTCYRAIRLRKELQKRPAFERDGNH